MDWRTEQAQPSPLQHRLREEARVRRTFKKRLPSERCHYRCCTAWGGTPMTVSPAPGWSRVHRLKLDVEMPMGKGNGVMQATYGRPSLSLGKEAWDTGAPRAGVGRSRGPSGGQPILPPKQPGRAGS